MQALRTQRRQQLHSHQEAQPKMSTNCISHTTATLTTISTVTTITAVATAVISTTLVTAAAAVVITATSSNTINSISRERSVAATKQN